MIYFVVVRVLSGGKPAEFALSAHMDEKVAKAYAKAYALDYQDSFTVVRKGL